MNFQIHIFDKVSEIKILINKKIIGVSDAFEIAHYYDSLTNTEEEALIYYAPYVYSNFYDKFNEALEFIEICFENKEE